MHRNHCRVWPRTIARLSGMATGPPRRLLRPLLRLPCLQIYSYSGVVNVKRHDADGAVSMMRDAGGTSVSLIALTTSSRGIRKYGRDTKSSVPRALSPPVEATSNDGPVRTLSPAATHARRPPYRPTRAYASECARFRHVRTPAVAPTLHVPPAHCPAELLGLSDTNATQDAL